MQTRPQLIGLIVLAVLAVTVAEAQTFRQRLENARTASLQPAATLAPLPPGARALRDIAYGSDPRQRFDVYLPAQPRNAPIILMVHGGGWAFGNKDSPGVVENKAAHWLPKGYVLVSANYRMRPDTAPLDQARDIARALAKVQELAPEWQADPSRVVLMGHSAGAHLVALVGASSKLWREAGAQRPRGVVSLESGAMDVPAMMARRFKLPLYELAFGDDPKQWTAASPYHQLTRYALPMLIVCSSQRRDSCPQGQALVDKAKTLGVVMTVLPEDLSHGEINKELGKPSAYTEAVDGFLVEVVAPSK
ncbi:alpha/beta hydrolase [Thermomonas sp.]|uniref:alpha/beta hydrolase n=1 Tax=Thermomonas sp. TaxID=1971895 RepID=UPI00248889AF|nr:alpha/beta hydrolase [Thermomonas sp.]MDI1252684.1 alpha/beta hydrolase [Thermomonas sp.]